MRLPAAYRDEWPHGWLAPLPVDLITSVQAVMHARPQRSVIRDVFCIDKNRLFVSREMCVPSLKLRVEVVDQLVIH